jgi:hypothetical protein
MSWRTAAVEELDRAMAKVVAPEPVALEGEWKTSRRRTYQSAESRPGVGPFVDVLDSSWTGSLAGANPVAALVFLALPTALHWVKSVPPAPILPVRISLQAYANSAPEQATFGASIGDAYLPAIRVRDTARPADTCAISTGPIQTGCVSLLASADGAEILVLLVPASRVRTGRNRLWRLREEYAAALSPRWREVLAHRRTGTLPVACAAP